jgi:hypothetical protein
MYIFGGSSGIPMNDFYELQIDKKVWRPVKFAGPFPGERFCHVGCVYKSSLYIFGGYDGSNRLNDFLEFQFTDAEAVPVLPASTLIEDLRALVNSELNSDICFVVIGEKVFAHKNLCMRCDYFRALLTNEMLESRAAEITIVDISRPIFLTLLEYLYTDDVTVEMDMAMELFMAADRYGVERLKTICESKCSRPFVFRMQRVCFMQLICIMQQVSESAVCISSS